MSSRSCQFIRAEGRIWVPRPSSWLGGWARHSWLKRYFGESSPLSIASPEQWVRLYNNNEVFVLSESSERSYEESVFDKTRIEDN